MVFGNKRNERIGAATYYAIECTLFFRMCCCLVFRVSHFNIVCESRILTTIRDWNTLMGETWWRKVNNQ